MNKTRRKKKKRSVLEHDHFLQAGALIVFTLLLFGFGFDKGYNNRAFPGVYVGVTNVGHMTEEEIAGVVASYADELDGKGIIYTARGRDISITPTIQAAEAGNIDASYDIIKIDSKTTAKRALKVGREGSLFNQWKRRLSVVLQDEAIPITHELNEDNLEQILRDNFSDLETVPRNARPKFKEDGFKIEPESQGELLDYPSALEKTKDQLSRGGHGRISLTLNAEEPKVFEEDIKNLLPILEKIIARAPYKINFSEEDLEWAIDKDTLGAWLTVETSDSGPIIAFDSDVFNKWLDDKIRKIVDRPLAEPELKIEDGKVSVFQQGHGGRAVNSEITKALWENLVLKDGSGDEGPKLPLVVDYMEPKQKIGDINDLGITELVAEAWTDFRGSPVNRILNIKNGAKILDGTLISPNEEFSTLKAIGPVTESRGFLPELVIKGNRTKPEVGGGLCQISTTMFRVALAGGVPIAERANHSYRVSYYEPPVGMDATIYEPSPDFRFINDYKDYLLLKTRVEGTRVIYQFWGKKDGRKIETTKPQIWGITAPPDTEKIETEDLPPGEEKCIERAHPGSDASFRYIVTYANGEKKEQEFFSRYKPWRAVCLIGKSEESESDSVAETQNPAPT